MKLFLLFGIGADRYALEAGEVIEVLPLTALKQIPGAPAWVSGLLTHRGGPVPVIDLSALATGTPAAARTSTRTVLVHYRRAGETQVHCLPAPGTRHRDPALRSRRVRRRRHRRGRSALPGPGPGRCGRAGAMGPSTRCCLRPSTPCCSRRRRHHEPPHSHEPAGPDRGAAQAAHRAGCRSPGPGAIARAVQQRLDAINETDHQAYWLRLHGETEEFQALIEAVRGARDPVLPPSRSVARAQPLRRATAARHRSSAAPAQPALLHRRGALFDRHGAARQRRSRPPPGRGRRHQRAGARARARRPLSRPCLPQRAAGLPRPPFRRAAAATSWTSAYGSAWLRRGNLLEPGLLDGEAPFDFVFCRNLLIYFDLATQRQAVARWHA